MDRKIDIGYSPVNNKDMRGSTIYLSMLLGTTEIKSLEEFLYEKSPLDNKEGVFRVCLASMGLGVELERTAGSLVKLNVPAEKSYSRCHRNHSDFRREIKKIYGEMGNAIQ